MPSYQQLLTTATQQLQSHSDSAGIDAEILLRYTIHQDRAWLLANADKHATDAEYGAFKQLVDQRQNGRPIAYLTGHKEFWSLDFSVNDNVLIPRGDSETLVESTLAILSPERSYNILELGTGSGAIALAIASERPQSDVLAVDISEKALRIASQNAERLGIKNCRFQPSNWFDQIDDSEKFDLIISNPPYVSADDKHLEIGDVRFEPRIALVAEENGLAALRHIIERSRKHLRPNGNLSLEHGMDQAEAVQTLLRQNSYQEVTTYLDLNRLPRVSSAIFE